ncbi:NUDIX hydrolase [Corynebacterium sp. 335C]
MVEIPTWLVVVIVVAVVALVVGLLASATAQRLNRMHVRCDLARLSLESALGRRGAVARAAHPDLADLVRAAEALPLTAADTGARADAENRLTAELVARGDEGLPGPLAIELHDARLRVELARRFYNDAVTDTRNLRRRPIVRWLRLAGTAPRPEFFDVAAPDHA